MKTPLLALLMFAVLAIGAPPPGFTIPKNTLSPDKRFGILVPDEKSYDAGEKNKLVEVSTGRVLAVIEGEPGMEQMNHGGVAPTRWSKDGSLLLWHVEGKWFPRALVLIKLDGDKVQWQLDLLKAGQQEILARTREAAPKQYAAAKKRNAGSGSDLPDGFVINVATDGEEGSPVSLPLQANVDLTSNPKAMPGEALNSTLEGEVGKDGEFKVLNFNLEK